MPSARRSCMAVSVSASQLIKLIKSVTLLVLKKENKPGTAQVGAIYKAQKYQKQFFSIFFEFFLVSGKSHSAEKCKRGPLGVFKHPFFCKIGKK